MPETATHSPANGSSLRSVPAASVAPPGKAASHTQTGEAANRPAAEPPPPKRLHTSPQTAAANLVAASFASARPAGAAAQSSPTPLRASSPARPPKTRKNRPTATPRHGSQTATSAPRRPDKHPPTTPPQIHS